MWLLSPSSPRCPVLSKVLPLALLAVPALTLVVGLAAAPAVALEGSVLERPTFDRDNNVILIPYRGAVPRFETETTDNGTRLYATFSGSQARVAAPYKLGVFHPFVSR